MGKRRLITVILIWIIILVVALGVMGFMIFSRVRTIDNEARKIAAMDIMTDDVDETIYSPGEYGVVESTMKDYVNTYIENVRKLTSVDSDETLLAMLGSANLQKDGPQFSSSRAYIKAKRSEIEDLKTTLMEMGTAQNVLNAFYAQDENFFFDWIYKRTMFNTLTLDFFYDASAIKAAADDLNSMLDKKEAVLNFLSDNSSGWQFGNNMIEFTDEKLLEKYLALVDEI